jgi:hypothetical protein
LTTANFPSLNPRLVRVYAAIQPKRDNLAYVQIINKTAFVQIAGQFGKRLFCEKGGVYESRLDV